MNDKISLLQLAKKGQLNKTGAKPKLPIELPSLTDGMLDVYRIPLEYLYYNNENGRIASTISRQEITVHPSRDNEGLDYIRTIDVMIVEDNQLGLHNS